MTPRRRWRDLHTGLWVVTLLVCLALALPFGMQLGTTGPAPWWAWLPLSIPAGVLVTVLASWTRGDITPREPLSGSESEQEDD